MSIAKIIQYRAKLKTNKQQISSRSEIYSIVKNTFFIFFMNNIVLLISSLIKPIFCLNIGDENITDLRLLRSMDIQCWTDSHFLMVLLFISPLILIFGLIIPFYIALHIYNARKKGKLRSRRFLDSFGDFVIPYKETRAFYEIFFILNKIIIVVFKEMFVRNIILGRLLIILMIFLFYLIAYLVMFTLFSPYNLKNYLVLSRMEKKIILVQISNIMAAMMWIATIEENIVFFSWMVVFYAGASNLVFFLWWFHQYFDFIKEKVNEILKLVTLFIKKVSKEKTVMKTFQYGNTIFKRNLIEAHSNQVDLLNEKIRKLKLLNNLLVDQLKNHEFNLSSSTAVGAENQVPEPEEHSHSIQSKRNTIFSEAVGFSLPEKKEQTTEVNPLYFQSIKEKKLFLPTAECICKLSCEEESNRMSIDYYEKNLIEGGKFKTYLLFKIKIPEGLSVLKRTKTLGKQYFKKIFRRRIFIFYF